MKKRLKPNKGTLVADESANRAYVRIAQNEGWKVISIPPVYRNIKLPDLAVVEKYTRGIHPLFTADVTVHLVRKTLTKGTAGFIIHRIVEKRDDEVYKEKIRNYFRKHTEKHTHNVIWTIEVSGEASSRKIMLSHQES